MRINVKQYSIKYSIFIDLKKQFKNLSSLHHEISPFIWKINALKRQQSCVYKELRWKEMVVTELTDEIVFVINDFKTKLMVL